MKQRQDTLDILHAYLSGHTAGGALLDGWISEVIESGDHGFEKGLLGLGWLIAFLIENDHIEGDADDILEDIDDTLYKLTIREVVSMEVNTEQLLSHVTYYQQRLQCKSKAHFYRRFTHFECMKLLLEKLNTFLAENNETFAPPIISDKVNVVLKYSYLTKTCIKEDIVQEAFYLTVEGLIDFFEQQEELTDFEEDLSKLYICVQQYENPRWVDRVAAIYPGGKDYSTKHDGLSPFCWANIYGGFPDQNLSLDKTISFSKAERYNLYLYLTNINQIHLQKDT